MSLQHIAVAVDPELINKGDVVIIKRSFFVPGQGLKTRCTKCADLFPTELRRMERLLSGGRRAVEVRNVPQCRACRSFKASATAPNLFSEPKALPASTTGLLRLENWSILGGRAFGTLRGGKRGLIEEGQQLTTSLIVEGPTTNDGGVVTIKTRSGSIYELGQKYRMPEAQR